MPEVLIDANVIIAARNANAGDHDRAWPIYAGVDGGELPRARVTNLTVPEVLHPIQKRARKEIATETLDILQRSRGFRFVHLPQSVYSEGERIFRQYDNPEWTDALLAAYMRSEELEYIYTFDDDFEEVDEITRLNSAVNPFDA